MAFASDLVSLKFVSETSIYIFALLFIINHVESCGKFETVVMEVRQCACVCLHVSVSGGQQCQWTSMLTFNTSVSVSPAKNKD